MLVLEQVVLVIVIMYHLKNSTQTGNGTIRWTGSDFEGRKGGAWVTLTAGGGATITGTLGTAAQPNITSVGTLTGLTMSGNIGRTSHSSGYLVGSFQSVEPNLTKTNPIYAIGSNFLPTDTSISGMYGIGFTHEDASFIPAGCDWGLYVCKYGNLGAFLSGHATGNSFVSGNFGVGTNTPSYKLDVNGTGRFTGNITGNLVGNVTGNCSGTAATVTGAAQTNITSVGTLSSLTVNDYITAKGCYRKVVIDLKSQSASNFYPIVLKTGVAGETHQFFITKTSQSGSVDYNEHLVWGTARGGGWSDREYFVEVHQSIYSTGTERSILGIYEGSKNFISGIVIYLRGGGAVNYQLYTSSYDVIINTSAYTTMNSNGYIYIIYNCIRYIIINPKRYYEKSLSQ